MEQVITESHILSYPWHHVWVATRRLQDWGPLYVRNDMVCNLWGWVTVVLKCTTNSQLVSYNEEEERERNAENLEQMFLSLVLALISASLPIPDLQLP